MIEWAIVWGVAQMGGAIAAPILKELAQGALEDYVKDFFKDCLGGLVGEFKQDDLKKAYGLAIKEFLILVEEELEFHGIQEALIKEYKKPLKRFVQDERVAATLGLAFQEECRSIPARDLIKVWKELESPYLPDEFDWGQISKGYIRAVKTLLKNSSELREIFSAQNLEQIAANTANLAGIQPDFNLAKYAETIQEQYGNVKLDSLDSSGSAYNRLRLWKIFVPQTVRECQEFLPQVFDIPKDRLKELRERGEIDDIELEKYQLEESRRRYVSQSPRSVLEMLQEPDKNYVVILGDPGSGKSTLLQYLALDWAEKPLRELPAHPLPLLIELRLYGRDKAAGKCKSFLEFLHQGNFVNKLNQFDVNKQLREGHVLALFDGVDEVFDPLLREEVINDIHGFTNDYPQVRVVVTSRWLGYKAQRLRDAEFQHFMLQDFEDEQVTTFIERWHELTFGEEKTDQIERERKEERLKKAVKDSKAIRQLAVNPLLLTMMAILNRHQELPRDRAKLYERASEVLLHQWDIERNLIDQNLDPRTIDVSDKQAILRRVADYMQASKDGLRGNVISGEELKRILFESLKEMEVENPKKVAGAMLVQLRHRNFILCDLGANNYGFVHRTFLEYFCASSFVRKFEKTKTLTFESLWRQTFQTHWQEETWTEVLLLIAGMIEPVFLAKVIDKLLDLDTEIKLNESTELTQAIKINDDIVFSVTNPLCLVSTLFALECFKELKNRKSIPLTGRKIKLASRKIVEEKCKILFEEINETTSNFRLNANKIISQIIKVFYQDSDTLAWLKQLLEHDDHWDVRQAAVQELARGWKNDPNTLPILKKRAQDDEDNDVRKAAVQELARGWKNDPDTLPWLKQRAQDDDSSSVRQAAVQELARGWKNDPDTLPWFKRWAQDNDVRKAAVQELARGWKNDPDTLPILKKRAQDDDTSSVRKAAVQELARGWKNDPDTLPILKKRAQDDGNRAVRQAAVQELARGWKNDPQMMEFFAAIALEDPFERGIGDFAEYETNPRQTALEILVKSYREWPRTLEILGDRMKNDSDKKVRDYAAEQLEKFQS